MLRKLAFAAAAVAALVGLTHCGGAGSRPKALTLKGSDTMVILGQRWAEQFMATHKGAVVQVTGGGSGTGIAALINGTTDICQSSRTMRQDEKLKLRDRYQTMGIETAVARDGVTIYVHESNPVPSLTIAQLRDIYMGKITNWKQVGGRTPRSRCTGARTARVPTSTSRSTLEGDFAASVQTLPAPPRS